MPFDLKKLVRDKRAWAVAGIGGAAGLGLAMRAKKGGSTPTGAAGLYDPNAPFVTGQPSVYDSSLQDLWEGFQQTAGDLQQQINEIGDQVTNPTTPPSATTPAPGTTAGGTAARKAPPYTIRQLRGTYNLRALAKRFSPNKSKVGVEAFLQRLVALNPSLRGKTTLTTGGFDLKVPTTPTRATT